MAEYTVEQWEDYVSNMYDPGYNVADHFPNWKKRPYSLAARPDSLKRKDSRKYLCLNSVPNPNGPGLIYQFEASWGLPSLKIEPAEPPYPESAKLAKDGYWTWPGGFRGVYRNGGNPCNRVEIPCPVALQHNLNRQFKIALVDGMVSDLEYATLVAHNDMVISNDAAFYHDMMGHVVFEVCQKPCSTKPWRMNRLRQVLDFYTVWRLSRDPLTLQIIEFCFGLSADLGFPCVGCTMESQLISDDVARRLFIERFSVTEEEIVDIIAKHIEVFFREFENKHNNELHEQAMLMMKPGDRYGLAPIFIVRQ
jgi:hypothetical protein